MNLKAVRIIAALSYLGMVVINALANALPINNIATGAVSDSYPNLFAPAGITFSIWGLIYLLLGAYVLYQLGVFGKITNKKQEELQRRIGLYFIISSVANILWIFSWHYDVMWLTLIFMVTILVCLIKISEELRIAKLKGEEYFFMNLPFSVYFGWITIATIANVTVFLVSMNWDSLGVREITWTILVLLIGTVIGMLTTLRNKDIPYALVLIWAYSGIVIKHVSETGFNHEYPAIISTAIFCITIFVLVIGFSLKKYFTVNKSRF